MRQSKQNFIYYLLFLTLNIFGNCYGQEFVKAIPVSKDVLTIDQISFKNKFSKSGWRSTYYYDNGNLIRQVNFYKNELRMDENFAYNYSNNSLKVKQNYTDEKGFSITLSYFDSLGRVSKSELYYSKDTINPVILSHNFVYSQNGKLISYKSTFIKTNQSDCFEFKYENDQLKELLFYNDCIKLSKKTRLSYDKNNIPVFEEIDYQDSNAVITGARSERGMQRFFYVFDKRGNWTKRYFVTSKGRKILEIKRKITYKNN